MEFCKQRPDPGQGYAGSEVVASYQLQNIVSSILFLINNFLYPFPNNFFHDLGKVIGKHLVCEIEK